MRTYIRPPTDLPLETPFGTAKLTVSAPYFIYLEGVFTVNRVEVQANLRLKDYGNGFEPEREAGYNALYTRRVGAFPGKDEISFAARRKLTDVLVPLVNEWAEQHSGVLDIARVARDNNDLLRLEGEIEELESKLAEKKSLLRNIAERIAGVK